MHRRSQVIAGLTLAALLLAFGANPGGAATRTESVAAASGLVAAYAFDEGAGSAVVDASGHGNTGTAANTAWSGAGRFGGALSFDGKDSWVTVPEAPSLDLSNAMTLEAWVKPTALDPIWRTVMVKEQPGQLVYALYANTDTHNPSGHVNGGTDRWARGTGPLPVDTWSFLAATYDGTTLRLFVDGNQVGDRSVSDVMAPSAGPLRFGGNSLWPEWFQGLLDNIRIYNRALSPAELQSDMQAPVGAASSPAPPPADAQPPSTPGGLSASAGQAWLALSWQSATDNVGVAGYDLYLDGSRVGNAAGASYTFSGLSCGRSYTLAVVAYDAAGNRSGQASLSASTSACPPTADTQPPSAPSALTKTAATQTTLSVAWNASSDNVGVAAYALYRDGASAGSTSGTTYTFTGLACGTSYTLEVEASDAAGNRSGRASLAAATSACAAPADTQPPSAPSGLTKTAATPTTISLAWNAATDNVGVAGYHVYRGSTAVGTATKPAATVSGLACGKRYTLGVDAYDAAGNRSTKVTLTARTTACGSTPPPPPTGDTQPPTAPTGLTVASTSQTDVLVNWSPSTDDVGVAGYGLYRSGSSVGSTAATTFDFGGLACGSSYTLSVDAYDAAGNRSAKTSLSATTSPCATVFGSVFVSTAGSDSNPCTQTAPCASFDRAYHVAQPGQVVQVAAGTYPEQTLLYDASKQGATQHVVFAPAAGASVTINGNINISDTRGVKGASHLTVRDMTLLGDVDLEGCGVPDGQQCPADLSSGSDDLTFQNLRVKGPYAFVCHSCTNVQILGGVWGPDSYLPCHNSDHPEVSPAYDSVLGGKLKRPNHILIDGARWQNFARCTNTDHTECLQFEPADYVTITDSVFTHCDTITLAFFTSLAYDSKSPAGYAAPDHVVLENNFLDHSYDATGGETYNALQIPDCTNCVIRNNSWLQNAYLPTSTSLNNVVVGNVGPQVPWSCGGSGITFSHNVFEGAACGPTDKNVTDVGFVNRATLDLHLKPGSPAINAGDPANYAATDMDGQTRPLGGAPDAGADEAG